MKKTTLLLFITIHFMLLGNMVFASIGSTYNIADDVDGLRIEKVNIGKNCTKETPIIKRNVSNEIVEFEQK